MFKTLCFTSELTTILLYFPFISLVAYYYSLKKPKPSPRPSNAETLVSKTAAAFGNHKGKMLIFWIIKAVYALFLSVKKNNGIGIEGIASSIVSPTMYILMMLKSAKNFTFDHLLGKGEWSKCLLVGVPWWGWVLVVVMTVPIVLSLFVLLLLISAPF